MSTVPDASGAEEGMEKGMTPKGWTFLRVQTLGMRLRAV